VSDGLERRTLGRTGLRVSVMGLGGGGDSRLGQARSDEAASVRLIRTAVQAGVNFIDTAEAYGTEEVIGKALRQVPRDQVVLSTKKTTFRGARAAAGGRGRASPAGADVRTEPADVVRSLEASLRRLGTDYVDVYHLHGVRPAEYTDLRDRLVPTLLDLKAQGKIRFLGITEAFAVDPNHRMLEQALADDLWDVVMVGFNILNQSARKTVFPRAIEQRVGTLVMFAVRRALSRPDRLREVLAELAARGKLPPEDAEKGLDFLLHEGVAGSIPDAAYRFCQDEPGVHVVLSGTGSHEHLTENIRALSGPALPVRERRRLAALFDRVDDVSGI
jgi:aryl-alcohol dehydrogenase-like predicted oxidoreductase